MLWEDRNNNEESEAGGEGKGRKKVAGGRKGEKSRGGGKDKEEKDRKDQSKRKTRQRARGWQKSELYFLTSHPASCSHMPRSCISEPLLQEAFRNKEHLCTDNILRYM